MRFIVQLLIVMNIFTISAQKVDRHQAIETIDFVTQSLERVHVNAFKYCPKDTFYSNINLLKEEISDSITEQKLCMLLQKNIALLKDGHTQLFLFDEAWDKHLQNNGEIFPIELEVNQNEKVIVKKNYSSSSPLKFGDELLEVNGLTFERIIKEEQQYVSAESEIYQLQCLFSSLPHILWSKYNLRDSVYNVKYLRDGVIRNEKIHSIKYLQTINNDQDNYTFEIKDRMGVLTMYVMYDKGIPFKKLLKSSFKQMQKNGVSDLIIDFRNADGGNSNLGDDILSYISDKPLKSYKKISVKKSAEMEAFYKDYFGKFSYFFIKALIPYLKLEDGEIQEINGGDIQPQKHGFKGNTYLLTSHQTYSSADMFVRIFQNYKLGTIIGEETGGKGIDFGEIIQLRIPKMNAYLDISCKEFYDVGEFENSGVKPDIQVDEKDAFSFVIDLIKQEGNSASYE
nr:S41 family peptidase [uncultured Carboxylicivirga sp.]